jgi:hypothetical protein
MAQEREPRPPVGIVQRLAQERESLPPLGAESAGQEAAVNHRLLKAARRAMMKRSSGIASTSSITPSASKGYGITPSSSSGYGISPWTKPEPRKNGAFLDAAQNHVAQATNIPSNEIKPDRTATEITAVNNSADSRNDSYHIGLHSLLSADDSVEETELEKKFAEAFNITLRTNPGILPGAPAVIASIKESLLKLQKGRAQKETEMRMQLEKVKNEKDQLEAQLRTEMGKDALRRSELTHELAARTEEKNLLEDALNKQIDAIEAIKRELSSKMTDVAKEKDELTTHLGFLSKSRAELEHALETEMNNVQKDRDALQKVLAERKKLQKQKMENKELESKIEIMSDAAAKERKTLQAEAAELKKFEDHVSQLRKQNEEAQKELELEKKHLKESADTMQTKKMILMESLRDLEAQFKEEIDELQGKIERSKMMHEEEMENVVKNRVMTYLRGGTRDETENMLVGRGEAAKGMGSHDPSNFRESHLDIESIVRERVEAELKKKVEAEHAEIAELKKKVEAERVEAELKKKMEAEHAEIAELKLKKKNMEAQRLKADLMEEMKENEAQNFKTAGFQASRKENKMRSEIDRLREDLACIQARTARHSTPSSIPDQRDDILQEIQELRHEIKSQNATTTYRSPLAFPSVNLTPPRSTLQRNNSVVSPRYGSVGVDGLGGNNNRLYREEEEEDIMMNRRNLSSTSPRIRRSGIYRGEEEEDMRMQRRNLSNAPPPIPRSPMYREEEEDDMRMNRRSLTSPRAPRGGRSRYYF